MKLNKVIVSGFMLVGLVGLTAGQVYAADLKIGVIDVREIMQKSPDVKVLNDKLKDKFKPRQDKLISTKNSIQTEMADFAKNQAVMKADEQAKLKDKIIADQNAYKADVKTFADDLAQEQAKVSQQFMDHLQTVVNTVAKQDHYNFIFYRAAVSYFDASTDVTQEVLDMMGKK